MASCSLFSRLKIAVAFAALCSLVFTSVGAAQSEQINPSAGSSLVVRIQSPAPGSRVAGNLTVNGAAVDCARGVAATRVAVYDGNDSSGTYIADASIDTNRTFSRYCTNREGSGQIGFTLIYNTRQLRDGPHTLAFVAEFPGGARASTTLQIFVDNYAPRYDARYDPYYDGYYGGYYGGYYPGYYGGYYGSYYPYYYGGVYVSRPYTTTYYAGCVTYGTCYGYGGYYGYYPYGYYPYGYYGYYNQNPYGFYTTNTPYYYCAYPYVAYGCGGTYGYTNITLHQAGQTVPAAGPVTLSGIATCSVGAVTSVSIYDRSFGQNTLIGTAAVSGGTYGLIWTPGQPRGARTIQVVAQGACGSFSQAFSVIVV